MLGGSTALTRERCLRTESASIDHPNFGSGGVLRNLGRAPRTTRAVATAHDSSTMARGTTLIPCHGIVKSAITTAATKASETPAVGDEPGQPPLQSILVYRHQTPCPFSNTHCGAGALSIPRRAVQIVGVP